jgi:uncharacterized protein (DUF2147 family)
MASAAFADDGDGVLGLWDTPKKDCRIEIFRCDQKYCGRIVWLADPDYPPGHKSGLGGRPRVDRQNPDAGLRDRPLVGLQLMEGFVFDGEDAWKDGHIYNPDDGKVYRCQMTLSAPDQLEVRGYVLIPLLGGTSVWTRAQPDGLSAP